MADDDARLADYLTHRGLVVRLAYDITGTWSDAEDVAQQVYVRWCAVETPVRNPRAYLARMATHQALDVVAARERVGYVGEFLPEPLIDGADADLLTAHEVEIALMVVLGSLSPLERAVFVLHDVFGFTHPEIATMLDRTPAAVRQLNHRARSHVQSRRPYKEVDEAALGTLVGTFLAAAKAGDVDGLVALLAEDATLVSDGGGKINAAIRPVVSAEKVARFLVGVASLLDPSGSVEIVPANGRPALLFRRGDGSGDSVLWVLVGDDGRAADLYLVRNPDKLSRLE